MKISPVPSMVTPSTGAPQQSAVESIRQIKMNTNATPLMGQIPNPQQQLPISDNNIDTQAAVEATQPLSPQLALLAKQRRALQVKEREIATREKALREQQTGSASIDVARLKADPLGLLLENGVTYDQLAEAITRGQGNPEIYAMKAKLEALEKGVEEKFTQKEQLAEQQVLAEMRREADMLVRSGNEFELIREFRGVPSVMDLIERTYRKSGEVLGVQEACNLVENELFKDAQRIAKAQKLQSQQPNPVAQQMQTQQRQTGMRTLTNRDTASVPMSAKQRAIAAFYGTLKR